MTRPPSAGPGRGGLQDAESAGRQPLLQDRSELLSQIVWLSFIMNGGFAPFARELQRRFEYRYVHSGQETGTPELQLSSTVSLLQLLTLLHLIRAYEPSVRLTGRLEKDNTI